MGRCEALLEQQPHRVAFVSERGLDTDQQVPEALAEDEDRAAVALPLARRRAPLLLDLCKPALAPDMVIGTDARMDVGMCAIAGGVAVDDALAQGVNALWPLDPVAGRPLRLQGVVERGEYRQIGRGAGIPSVGRKVEKHHRDLALGARRLAQGDQTLNPFGQHLGALGVGVHVARAHR
jgi:hypothetical protein